MQGNLPRHQTACLGKDLPGLQSHVRYSIFKERRHVERFSRGEKRTGNLAFVVWLSQVLLLREGLFLQHAQDMRAAHACQGDKVSFFLSIVQQQVTPASDTLITGRSER